MAAIVSPIQVDLGTQEMKHLAEHLAGIPGRKNLIWLTTTFQLKPSNLQKLINANVASLSRRHGGVRDRPGER